MQGQIVRFQITTEPMKLPGGAKVISAMFEGNTAFLYILVNKSIRNTSRLFIVLTAGNNVPLEAEFVCVMQNAPTGYFIYEIPVNK